MMQHWLIVHVEQVDWGMDEPLGVMIPDLHSKAVPAEYRRLPLNTEVLPIMEAEVVLTHMRTTEGDMHEGGMHKGDVKGAWTKGACTRTTPPTKERQVRRLAPRTMCTRP